MISKKRALIYSIILVIVTIICTSMFQITLGNKVIISKNLYELYSKYDKLLGLENVIESEYYQKVSEEDLIDGALKGLLIVYVILAVVYLISPLLKENATKSIDETILTKAMYNNNIITKIIL